MVGIAPVSVKFEGLSVIPVGTGVVAKGPDAIDAPLSLVTGGLPVVFTRGAEFVIEGPEAAVSPLSFMVFVVFANGAELVAKDPEPKSPPMPLMMEGFPVIFAGGEEFVVEGPGELASTLSLIIDEAPAEPLGTGVVAVDPEVLDPPSTLIGKGLSIVFAGGREVVTEGPVTFVSPLILAVVMLLIGPAELVAEGPKATVPPLSLVTDGVSAVLVATGVVAKDPELVSPPLSGMIDELFVPFAGAVEPVIVGPEIVV